MTRPLKPNSNEKVIGAVRPNLGLEIAYRNKLLARLEAMHNSIVYWLSAEYKANPPRIAQDVSPAELLSAAIKRLTKQWTHNFDELAQALADHFAQDASERSDAALKAMLKKGGFSVQFTMSPAMRDIIQATVSENVSLIKSIPARYLTDVEGIVMRSVQRGGDLGQLSEDLQKTYGVTKRRAALIARDQNTKATSAMNRARQVELGITEAIWMHSSAGKHPRPSHVKNNGKRYNVKEGWYDPEVGRNIFPGELINCRCFPKSIIPGFD